MNNIPEIINGNVVWNITPTEMDELKSRVDTASWKERERIVSNQTSQPSLDETYSDAAIEARVKRLTNK